MENCITLKNDCLAVMVSPAGAELRSIKQNNGEERLWQGDPEWWNGQAPSQRRFLRFAGTRFWKKKRI